MDSADTSGAAPPQVRAEITLTVNGTEHRISVDTRASLLDVLRERLGLTGSKKGCDHGQCGACTLLLDGRRANGCLALAVAHDGAEVVTVEGLAGDGGLSLLQEAFLEYDAFQCGYCTPGQLCSATAMLDEAARGWPSAVTPDVADGAGAPPGAPVLDDAEIRERMSGNLCRCGAYVNIVAALRAAAGGIARRTAADDARRTTAAQDERSVRAHEANMAREASTDREAEQVREADRAAQARDADRAGREAGS